MELKCDIEWIEKVTVHRKGIFTWKYTLYGILIALYCVLIPWMYATIGEPYQQTLLKNEELAEAAIDEGLEELDERPLPSQNLPNPWAFVAFILVFSANALIHLLAQWFVWFDAWCNYNETTNVRVGDFVLVRPVAHRGKTTICEIKSSDVMDCLTFTFHRLVYQITEDSEVEELEYPIYFELSEYANGHGLEDNEDIEIQTKRYGLNQFNLPRPTFLDIYKEQCVRPIVIFQLFSALLWALDTYVKYTLFSIMSIFGFEAASVFQRHKNLNTLRGLSNPSFKIMVKRKFKWIESETDAILPGDLISLTFDSSEAHKLMIPCDCLLLEGVGVVNEATLTGESVPQMKEAVNQAISGEELDMEERHRIHCLYSGTKIISLSNVEGSTPDGGVLCYVLRTGFASSQGKLMRMIEFSKTDVSGNAKETIAALSVLLCFALVAAYYVLVEGMKKGDRTTYEIVVKCILIITSVVPPSFPMQMALAVNTALMSLLKKGVFCTEPYRVPDAGRIATCLFDKTGTITTDELIPSGVVNDVNAPKLRSFKEASKMNSIIIAGCHSLLTVEGELIGDPIETAAINGVEWRWDNKEQTAYEGNWDKQLKKKKELDEELVKMNADGKTPPELKQKHQEKIDALKNQITKAQNIARSSKLSVTIQERFHFSSKLQRMSTICDVQGLPQRGYYSLVKGSPEMIRSLSIQVPEWYEQEYSKLAETGKRVLALAYRYLGKAKLHQFTREDIESDLVFAGFCAFECKIRGDSPTIMKALIDSEHSCLMVTGDAPLTSVHVARKCNMIGADKTPFQLEKLEDNRMAWCPMYFQHQHLNPIPFRLDEMETLVQDYALIVTEKALREVDELWQAKYLNLIPVYSRMSPQGKAEVVDELKKERGVLYIGDGGNDVGALKNADVGIALLSGFGNTNVDEIKAEETDDVWALLSGRKKEIGKRARKKQMESREKMNRKKRALQNNQQEMFQEAVEKRKDQGQDGVMGHMYAMWDVMNKHKTELQAESKDLKKKHGTGFAAGAAKWAETMDEDNLETGDGPMVTLGDASVSAPFTSRAPSIQAVIDIVRQGRCTLLSSLQQQQIMMLECIISAYTLSALSLQGSRNSEIQMMSTGILLMVASLAFTYSTPIDKIDKVSPLTSLFHPAVFVSLIGQAIIHLAVLVIGVQMAKDHMGEEKLKEVTRFFRDLDRKMIAEEAAGIVEEEEDPWESMMKMFNTPFMPNLMNSCVFLLRSAEEVGVLLVNYKGRPWMKGFTENHALCLSLVMLVSGVVCAAWGVFPELNNMLQLEPFPDDEFRFKICYLVLASLFGTFVWDRLCLAIFAPRIFKKQWSNVTSTSIQDLLPLITTVVKTIGILIVLSTGNILMWGLAYWMYRKYKANQTPQD